MVTGNFVLVRLYATYKNQIEDAIRFWNEMRDEARESGDVDKILLYADFAHQAWRMGRKLKVPGSL